MAIQVGDRIPSFTLPNQKGEQVNIDALIGKKNLVIYFYPKDETAGCTAEACSFRDNYEAFEELGCEVIGISGDSIQAHEKFAASHRLNFTLLADTEKKVRKQFGVPANLFGLLPGRVTYIADREGIVRSVHNSQLNPKSHIGNALSEVRKLQG
jgi:thioredoxin-dependent peroxiredoxin